MRETLHHAVPQKHGNHDARGAIEGAASLPSSTVGSCLGSSRAIVCFFLRGWVVVWLWRDKVRTLSWKLQASSPFKTHGTDHLEQGEKDWISLGVEMSGE